MKNFLTSLFASGKKEETTADKQKNELKNFDILKYDGIRAQKIGRIPYAIKCFTEALNIREDFETMNYLAGAYTSAQETAQALEVLNRMVELEPEHIPTRFARINTLFHLDRDAEVIADCTHVLALEADNHIALYLLARAKRTTGDPLGAVADLTKAIAQKEEFTEAWLLRAELLLEMKQGKEALEDVAKVLELSPEEERAFLLRGRIHQLLGDLDAATEDYQIVIAFNPFNEEAWLLSGQLLITEQNYEDAIIHFDEAIEIDPQFAKAYAERGRVKNAIGDKDGAFEDLKKAIELNPEGEMAQRINGQHSNFNDLYKGGIF